MKRSRIDKIVKNELDTIIGGCCDCCCNGGAEPRKDILPAIDDIQILHKLIQSEINPIRKRKLINAYNELIREV